MSEMKRQIHKVQTTDGLNMWQDDLEFEHFLGALNRVEVLLHVGRELPQIRIITTFEYADAPRRPGSKP